MKLKVGLIFLLIAFSIKAQKRRILNDFTFTLHEETVNKVLTAIGEISGSNDYEVMFIKGKYHWTIQNPQIHIRPDSSQFDCVALVTVGPFSYKTNVDGDVKITYDKVNDKIVIKITRAIFELYTIVFDKKIHIKNIHLEDHFKDPFLFDGPKSYGTSMDVSLPDSATKKIYVQPTDCQLYIKWREVKTVCEITASDKPIPVQSSTLSPKPTTITSSPDTLRKEDE
ncbi:MAG: hypothetical protein AB7O73_10755 [Bacteroidia bacterium]